MIIIFYIFLFYFSNKPFNLTRLSYAAKCNDMEHILSLVERGEDINAPNSDGSKPLHLAAQAGHKNIVKYFLNLGISANILTNKKYTPLHYAAAGKQVFSLAERQRYQEVVQSLFNYKADLDAVDGDGFTPLLLAARKGNKHTVELLIKLGASVDICDDKQWTLLHYAVVNKWTGIIRSLLEGNAIPNPKDSRGCTPLYYAIKDSSARVVDLLIEAGANLQGPDTAGKSLLHHATSFCTILNNRARYDVVKYLLNKGHDPNARDSFGCIPLCAAVLNLSFEVVESLLEYGSYIECCGCWEGKERALHYACKYGWVHIVQIFVSKELPLNDQNQSGDTALHMAVRSRHLNVIQCLLTAGEFCNIKNKGLNLMLQNSKGDSPLHEAVRSQNEKILQCLLPTADHCNTILNDRLNMNNRKFETPLHMAVQLGNINVIKCLLTGGTVETLLKGLDINPPNHSGDTPLHLAVKSGNYQIIECLLNAGADCNRQNIYGQTAFSEFLFNPYLHHYHYSNGIAVFIQNGAYLQYDFSNVPLLREMVLQNTKLCAQYIINRFNNVDLPNIYRIPMIAERLPSIEKFKIVSQRNLVQDIEETVAHEMQVKGFCDVLNVQPIVLRRLCVESLVKYYNN